MSSLQRWEVITDKYKPDAAALSDAMKAADKATLQVI